ncbi:hypothetical protein O0880_09860 [Janthinobacterium sp. SUN118]|uniref:hypothetical protein n=1 Tax=Janthinobacterium sp. SUN118 TaxID=3004100 RepID=UPI0025B25204|nr:hypothetical protein [Janthinobacterium sp. SUN118]MDN2709725.1 hypothetical protein [Janthinobacterium sp. SUN118]
MTNKKYLAAMLAIASLITSMPASANYTCSGPVKGVSINGLGAVVAESIGKVQWGFLCNVETATNGINPATCKVMYATLLAAQASGRSVTLWVTDSATVCPDLPARWNYVSGFNLLRMDD